MDVSKDYYATLGVLPSAEEYIVHAAYKALCKRYHPDVYKAPDAHVKMAEINEAFRVLSDKSKRAEYDSIRKKNSSCENQEFNDQFSDKKQRVDPFAEDWVIAVGYFPELKQLYQRLEKISTSLALSFRNQVLCKKQYSNASLIAEEFERKFLNKYFGKSNLAHAFAKELVGLGRKDVLLDLNKSIKVIGFEKSEEIIKRLRLKYDLPDDDELKRRKSEKEKKDRELKIYKEKKRAESIRREKRDRYIKKIKKIKKYATCLFTIKKIAFCLLALFLSFIFVNKWHWLAAFLGLPSSQFIIGEKYHFGNGVDVDYDKAYYWYDKSSSSGYGRAFTRIGNMYYDGVGFSSDIDQAIKFWTSAADLGDGEAFFCLGKIYENKELPEDEHKKAHQLYINSAELNFIPAFLKLGEMYYHGEGIDQDYEKAFYWYSKSASQGEAIAQYEVGQMYEDGVYVEKNYSKAFNYYLKSSGNGLKKSFIKLGYFHENGLVNNASIPKALEYYTLSADSSSPESQFRIGRIYGKKNNYKKEVYWYEMAANSGNLDALYYLGLSYQSGKGVGQDEKKAFEYFKKAAEKGDPEAQFLVGLNYSTGKILKKDLTKSIYWFKQASSRNLPNALYCLGDMYFRGEGITQDYEEALSLFIRSARQGYEPAILALSKMYEEGIGVSSNKIRSIAWLFKARSKSGEVRKRIDIIKKSLSDNQLKQAVELDLDLF